MFPIHLNCAAVVSIRQDPQVVVVRDVGARVLAACHPPGLEVVLHLVHAIVVRLDPADAFRTRAPEPVARGVEPGRLDAKRRIRVRSAGRDGQVVPEDRRTNARDRLRIRPKPERLAIVEAAREVERAHGERRSVEVRVVVAVRRLGRLHPMPHGAPELSVGHAPSGVVTAARFAPTVFAAGRTERERRLVDEEVPGAVEAAIPGELIRGDLDCPLVHAEKRLVRQAWAVRVAERIGGVHRVDVPAAERIARLADRDVDGRAVERVRITEDGHEEVLRIRIPVALRVDQVLEKSLRKYPMAIGGDSW